MSVNQLLDNVNGALEDDGFPEPIEIEDLMAMDFSNVPCEQCGKPSKECSCEFETCFECEQTLDKCECDQHEQVNRLKEHFDALAERFQKETDAQAEGEFTASMVLDRSENIFQHVAQEIARTANVPETFATAGLLFAISSAAGKGLFAQFRNGQRTSLGLFMQHWKL